MTLTMIVILMTIQYRNILADSMIYSSSVYSLMKKLLLTKSLKLHHLHDGSARKRTKISKHFQMNQSKISENYQGQSYAMIGPGKTIARQLWRTNANYSLREIFSSVLVWQWYNNKSKGLNESIILIILHVH